MNGTEDDPSGISDQVEALTCEHLTCGKFRDEPTSCAYLDAIVDESLWTIYREVHGAYMNFKPWQEREECKIDRILSPTKKLLDLGWRMGPIGIECKKSDTKIGPALCQCFDYTNAVWHMPRGTWLVLQWIFLWPLEGQKSTVESIMAQSRVGSAWQDRKGRLRLKSGGTNAFAYGPDETPVFKTLLSGRKVGTR